jgi:5-methylcytosine-specific restriction endonuclease McrA
VTGDSARLDRIVAAARAGREAREHGYRAQALRLLPWVCTRCARTFDRAHVHQLTVHHRDHNHDHNPPDGSNWELLCVYCHENEHAREVDAAGRTPAPSAAPPAATWQPFAALGALIKGKK